MIKKVKTADLRVGMYIHDLNVPWLDHGFVRSRFLLKDEKQIEKIIYTSVSEVLIDTVRGLDAVYSPTLEEAESVLVDKMIKATTEVADEAKAAQAIAGAEPIDSRALRSEAVKVVRNILGDAKAGKQANIKQATPMVVSIAKSVLQNDGTLVSLCRIKQKDTYTFQHSVSVSALLVTFCNIVGGFGEEQLIEIGLGALFHDVGKMMIPDEILNKPGRLTEDEFAVMQSHVQKGVEYLQDQNRLSDFAMNIVAEHHERCDGTGYPKGLKHDSISEIGQMVSIVDVYDAITSNRVYHPALEPPDALRRIFEWSGKHFDEVLVQKLIKGIGIYPIGSLVRLASDNLAVVVRQEGGNILAPVVQIVFDAKAGHNIVPKILDLSSPHCLDHIVGYEMPKKWGIDPIQFIAANIDQTLARM